MSAIEVGDIIESGGRRYRVNKAFVGSWSGVRYFDCQPLNDPHARSPLLYEDQVKLCRRATEPNSDARREEKKA